MVPPSNCIVLLRTESFPHSPIRSGSARRKEIILIYDPPEE